MEIKEIHDEVIRDIATIQFIPSKASRNKMKLKNIDENVMTGIVISIFYDWAAAFQMKILPDAVGEDISNSLRESLHLLKEWLSPKDYLHFNLIMGEFVEKWIKIVEALELYEIAANFIKINDLL